MKYKYLDFMWIKVYKDFLAKSISRITKYSINILAVITVEIKERGKTYAKVVQI